jgi:aryl-alcohol dehydrogenase-like predicted oxidoreductase
LAGNKRLINLVRKVLGPFPGLLKRVKRRAGRAVQPGVFDPATAAQSLETSLRELGTDYVDLLLLHESTLAEATNDALLRFLEDQVRRGAVRHLGIGSEFPKLQGDVALFPAAYRVFQFSHNARERNLVSLANRESRGLIVHSAFGPAAALNEAIRAEPSLARQATEQVGADLSDPAVVGSLLLHYALWSNPDGVVLFSSSSPDRIEANAREAESRRFDGQQLEHFAAFVDQALSTGR